MKKKLVFLFILLFSTLIYSSPLSETVGAMSTTNPLSARMFAQGTEATYFNPALLVLCKRKFTMNVFYSHQNLDVSLMERPAGSDVVGDVDKGTGIYGATQDGLQQLETNLPYKTRPTEDLYKRGGQSQKSGEFYGAIGLVLPIIEDYLAIGFHGVLPMGNIMRQDSFFNDEREANFSNSLHFELYDDRMSAFNLSFALSGGYKWIYAGIGATVSAEAVVTSDVFTPDAGKNENKIHAKTEIKAKFRPHFALNIRPWKALNIGFTAHLATKTNVDVENIITFWYIDREKEKEINTNTVNITWAYQPLTLSPSVALDGLEIMKDLKISVGFTAIWRKWSDYVDRYSERPEGNIYWDSSVENMDDDGNLTSRGGWVYETTNKYKWKDTWEFVIGAGVEYKALKTGIDLGYFMSPIPNQDGRTNYVDNDKFNIGAGVSYTWKIKKYELEVGANFQAQIFIEKTTTKDEGVANSIGKDGTVVDEFPDSTCDGFDPDCVRGTEIEESKGFQTNNPGYPGFTSSGQILSGGLWLSLYF